MSSEKKVMREFRVTVTVEEIEAPKVADIPAEQERPFSREAEDFFDEADYSSTK